MHFRHPRTNIGTHLIFALTLVSSAFAAALPRARSLSTLFTLRTSNSQVEEVMDQYQSLVTSRKNNLETRGATVSTPYLAIEMTDLSRVRVTTKVDDLDLLGATHTAVIRKSRSSSDTIAHIYFPNKERPKDKGWYDTIIQGKVQRATVQLLIRVLIKMKAEVPKVMEFQFHDYLDKPTPNYSLGKYEMVVKLWMGSKEGPKNENDKGWLEYKARVSESSHFPMEGLYIPMCEILSLEGRPLSRGNSSEPGTATIRWVNTASPEDHTPGDHRTQLPGTPILKKQLEGHLYLCMNRKLSGQVSSDSKGNEKTVVSILFQYPF
ncbi:hypothetical protein J3R30DRAFT_3405770 [Lentinula aciculospora]|uniref:Uncharacterized protein n=1 Tax=Lentinula aciculospora TaxID=153920 RepID=A0A9W9A7J0_9AGAR|nr:hypothetical protein J3R30DRAFT_3405770 [Lentinula aciculospora]